MNFNIIDGLSDEDILKYYDDISINSDYTGFAYICHYVYCLDGYTYINCQDPNENFYCGQIFYYTVGNSYYYYNTGTFRGCTAGNTKIYISSCINK